MHARSRVVCSVVTGLTIACGGSTPDKGTDTGSPEATTATTVPTIVSVTCTIQKSAPPQLIVVANGEVPTGGWSGETLNRRTYVSAPADSIWEYDFMATPPSGMATQVITPVTAQDTWAYPQSIVGIRVYGEGSGTKEVRLTACTAQ
jgi:hypothetical protein